MTSQRNDSSSPCGLNGLKELYSPWSNIDSRNPVVQSIFGLWDQAQAFSERSAVVGCASASVFRSDLEFLNKCCCIKILSGLGISFIQNFVNCAPTKVAISQGLRPLLNVIKLLSRLPPKFQNFILRFMNRFFGFILMSILEYNGLFGIWLVLGLTILQRFLLPYYPLK